MGPPGPGAPTPLFSRSFEVGGRDTPIDCVCARDVPAESIAAVYADMQQDNPILVKLGVQYEDLVKYGQFLARNCSPLSMAAVVRGSSPPRAVGIQLNMFADLGQHDASDLPRPVAIHWAMCVDVADQVRKHIQSLPPSRRTGRMPELFSMFIGLVREARGSGLFDMMQRAYRVSSSQSGVTHMWCVTFSKPVVATALKIDGPLLSGGRFPFVIPILRKALPKLFDGVAAPVVQAVVAASSFLGVIPRRLDVWAYRLDSFKYNSLYPLSKSTPNVMFVGVLYLRDPSWPESRL
eukprot:TRINITY_DN408_c0_g3_i1.p1 TRINITY_DN408_c0_g3~~TRINITY_DN408_c0_g3_i1.p1  ORF type:complete len:314 (+),score=62.25 TRINITY_DN408_c0_g3_i1:65-943(+)